MCPVANDQSILDQVLLTLKEREQLYGAAIQTSVLMKVPAGLRNLLTVFSFTQKDTKPSEPLFFDYSSGIIARRSFSAGEFKRIVKQIVTEGLIEIKTGETPVPVPVTFAWETNFRKFRSEWIKWPADVFRLQTPRTDGCFCLISVIRGIERTLLSFP